MQILQNFVFTKSFFRVKNKKIFQTQRLIVCPFVILPAKKSFVVIKKIAFPGWNRS